TIWGNETAIQGTLAAINDSKVPLEERLKAIQSTQQLKSTGARETLLKLMSQQNPEPLLIEGLRALSTVGGDAVAAEIVKNWKRFSPVVRQTAAEVLVSRSQWTGAFLSAVEEKTIPTSEISPSLVRTIANYKNAGFNSQIERLLGKYHESSADKLKLIRSKRKVVLNGEPNIEHGHDLAKKTCFVCHKLYGEGAEVGPDLTGVGRSTLDALLANVIDPNQIVGKGYENVMIETKDGRSVSGRIVENSDTQVKLLAAGPAENLVAKSNIESMRVSELSVMPEGLEQMPDEDFRDLVWFILSPPQEGALTPEKRQALSGK
ncbi:MAG: PVC-type heme-binding CxxCH protein, partial [Limisphaerales bacterium]